MKSVHFFSLSMGRSSIQEIIHDILFMMISVSVLKMYDMHNFGTQTFAINSIVNAKMLIFILKHHGSFTALTL